MFSGWYVKESGNIGIRSMVMDSDVNGTGFGFGFDEITFWSVDVGRLIFRLHSRVSELTA